MIGLWGAPHGGQTVRVFSKIFFVRGVGNAELLESAFSSSPFFDVSKILSKK